MLYLIVSSGFMKVGYTSNLSTFSRRLSQYKTHNPNVGVIGICRGSKKLEKYFHSKCRLLKGSEFAIWDPNVVAEFMRQPTFYPGIPQECFKEPKKGPVKSLQKRKK